MTFVAPLPNQTYHPRVYAAFGFTIDDDPGTWVWTDITRYCRNADGGTYGPMTLSGGRPALSGTADPSQITLVLDNTDGRFTALSPYLRNGSANPYYPNVVINTPLKVAVTWDRATAEYELLTGFVIGWPLQPVAGVINVTVPITAQGRLRILRRSTQTTASALFREIKRLADSGVVYDGYWPMEDDATSLRFVHGPVITANLANIVIPGIPRVAPATITDVPGSKPLPDFSKGAHVTAPVTQINSAGTFTLQHVLFVGDTPSGSGLVPTVRMFYNNGSFRLSMDMSASEWQLDSIDTGGAVTTIGTQAWSTGGANGGYPFDNSPHMVKLLGGQSGPDIDIELWIDGIQVISTSLAGGTFTNVTQVGVAGAVTGFPFGIGHLLVYNKVIGVLDMTSAMQGFLGELATVRMQRLADGENLPITILTGTVPSQAMGPQSVDTIDNLFEETSDADNGLFHDAGTNGGLVYASGSYRYNRAIDMTLDYNRHHIGDNLASTYDDQNFVNSVTISRSGGSSATKPDMPSTGVLYATSDTVNVAYDDQLDDIAGWRLHEGTFAGYRLPTIDINMRTTPDLADEATSLELPFRISPINVPSPFPPQSLDQFAEAFVTTFDSVRWENEYACTPYGPWAVAVYGTSRYDAAGTVLTSSETLASTDWTLTPAVANDWTTTAASMPFQASCEFEVVTVADITNGTSIIPTDGSFELNNAPSNWSPTSCTFNDDAAHVHTGSHAAKLVVTGTPAQAFARTNQVSGIVVADNYTCSLWMFSVGGIGNAQVAIDWFTSGGAFISTSNTTVTLSAATWTKISIKAPAPATAAKASCGPTLGGSPATGATVWVDDVIFTHNNGPNGTNQTMLVIRNQSGVLTTHASGAAVHVYPLPIYAV